MADVSKFPATLNTFQWSRPSAENPRLRNPIGATDTSFVVTNAPKDRAGAVITGSFLMNIKNAAGYTETVWVPAGAVSADGLTFTGVVRGIYLSGIDYTTSNSGLATAFDADAPVACNISATIHAMMISTLQGYIASGGNSWYVGDEAATDKTVYLARTSIAGNNPYWGWDESASGLVFSNDGISSTPFGTGAGVTGGDGIDVTAGAISADLATNPGLEISSAKLRAKIKASGGIDRDSDGLSLTLETEVDQALNGISANVTDTNLNTMTAGLTSDASSLHTHNAGVMLNLASVVGVTTDTVILTEAITAVMAANDNVFEIDVYGITSGNGAMTIGVYYDATLMHSFTLASDTAASDGSATIKIVNTSTSAQLIYSSRTLHNNSGGITSFLLESSSDSVDMSSGGTLSIKATQTATSGQIHVATLKYFVNS